MDPAKGESNLSSNTLTLRKSVQVCVVSYMKLVGQTRAVCCLRGRQGGHRSAKGGDGGRREALGEVLLL